MPFQCPSCSESLSTPRSSDGGCPKCGESFDTILASVLARANRQNLPPTWTLGAVLLMAANVMFFL